MRECSEVASIQTYKPFDIVYVADRGQISPVHIILSGRCSIIQYLNMNVFLLLEGVHLVDTYGLLRQVQYDKCHERVLNLHTPKKMESNCDIIQKMSTMASDHNRMEIAVKDDIISDIMVNAAAAAAADTDISINNVNANEATVTMSDRIIRRSHFVEIGEFSCGSIFNLGEHMDDRAIVAKHTQVQCLLIPHYWLFEKKQNAGNIWQRTKIYLDFALPSREKIFENYVLARKWKSYKKQLIHNSKSRRPLINSTKIQDVPIICRLNDTF